MCNFIFNKKINKIFIFSNYFSIFNLVEQLQQNKMYAIGTTRTNRFIKLPILAKIYKQISQIGKRTTNEICTNMINCSLNLVKTYVQ